MWSCVESYHEEEGGAHGAEQLGGVGGDCVDTSAPGQRVKPRLADYVQVGGDVCSFILTAYKRGEEQCCVTTHQGSSCT